MTVEFDRTNVPGTVTAADPKEPRRQTMAVPRAKPKVAVVTLGGDRCAVNGGDSRAGLEVDVTRLLDEAARKRRDERIDGAGDFFHVSRRLHAPDALSILQQGMLES